MAGTYELTFAVTQRASGTANTWASVAEPVTILVTDEPLDLDDVAEGPCGNLDAEGNPLGNGIGYLPPCLKPPRPAPRARSKPKAEGGR